MTDENLHLTAEKRDLLAQVKRQVILLEDMKSQMDELRLQTREERKMRAKGRSGLVDNQLVDFSIEPHSINLSKHL